MTPKEFEKFAKQYLERTKLDRILADRRTARICSIIANVNRDIKKKPKPYTEDDFMPKEKEKKKEKMSINNMRGVLEAITIAFGGKIEN